MSNFPAPDPATHLDSKSTLFSLDSERRAIEIAFIRRLFDLLGEDAANLLSASSSSSSANAKPSEDSSFEVDLARVRHPLFALLARAIERDFPDAADFGKFGENSIGKPGTPTV